MSDAKAEKLKQTVASYKLDDAPAAKTRPSTSDRSEIAQRMEAARDMMDKLEDRMGPGASHPDIDTDEAAWQKRVEEMDHPVIEVLDIASELSLGVAGKATKTLSKRLVKWAARAGMAKDAVQGFQKGVDDASRDVLRNAGVDPAKPEAVRAWLDKDPLNRKALMQAGVAAMAQNLAIGKAAGKLTGGIDGPQGAAAEMAARNSLMAIFEQKRGK